MKVLSLAFWFSLTLGYPGSAVFAQSPAQSPFECRSYSKEIAISSGVGSAGTWANLRNAEGSLRFETAQMLGSALKNAKTAIPPAGLCPQECKAAVAPLVLFSATPHKLLDKYSDKTECEKLLSQTSTVPFEYSGLKFASSEDLANWFNEFSQGKGSQGKDLYLKCYGSCSPRYLTEITPSNSSFNAATKVVCGHARDKSDDMYELKVTYVWRCDNIRQ